MHPVHAIEASLATMPATIGDLLGGLPPGQVIPVSTRNNPSAQETVRAYHRVIALQHLTGASELPQGLRGWSVNCASGQHVLIGHVYPGPANNHGDLARDCPLLLLDRFSLEVYYGPELPALAKSCLANNLAYQAIGDLQN